MKRKDQNISDDLITYNLNLIKYGNKTTREVLTFLGKMEADILSQLDSDLPEWKKSRLNKVLKSIGETTTAYYEDIAASVGADLIPIPAAAQSAFNGAVAENIGAEFTALASKKRLEAMATTSLIQGAPNAAWWKKQDTDLKFKIQNTLRQGHAQGVGIHSITRDMKSIMGVAKRTAETLVRTSIMTVNNDALEQLYKNNSDVVDKVEWLATLDSRTCKYCMSMDGRKYDLEATKPQIPAHMNCRCIYSPVTKTWRQMGIDIDELEPARRSMDDIVPGETTFDKFLDRKGKVFQDDMLGPGRAQLWRDGKITISDLVNNRGRELSLAELKAL